MKPHQEARFVALLRDAIAQRATAEELADKRLPVRRRSWQVALALKGLIAFVVVAQRQRGGAAEGEGGINEVTMEYHNLEKCFRRRLHTFFFEKKKKLWEGLLQEYTHELATTQSGGEGVLATDTSRLAPQAQEEDATKVVARKIGGGGFKASPQ